MNDLIRRKDAMEAMRILEAEDNERYGCSIPECFDSERAIEALEKLPSAEQERTAKVENKWHWNCDPYDESTSPTEAGYYRIIDEDGTEMTDYFFGEPRMTRIGIGYWATCEKTILAWTRLEVTDGMA